MKEFLNYGDFNEFGHYFNWNWNSCGIIAISVSLGIINWKSCGIIAIAVGFGIILIAIERVVELLWFLSVLELS